MAHTEIWAPIGQDIVEYDRVAAPWYNPDVEVGEVRLSAGKSLV